MRLQGLLDGSDEPRSEIDGFVCDFDAPWNAGHRMIERYAAEVIPTGPKWDSDYSLRKFESGRRMLDASPEQLADITVAPLRGGGISRPMAPRAQARRSERAAARG